MIGVTSVVGRRQSPNPPARHAAAAGGCIFCTPRVPAGGRAVRVPGPGLPARGMPCMLQAWQSK